MGSLAKILLARSETVGDIPQDGAQRKGRLGRIAHKVIETIYPSRCMVCDTYTDTPNGLCPACWSDTAFISGAKCKRCGTNLPGEGTDLTCDQCLSFPPAWQRGAAVFGYSGGGRRLVLSLKHGDRLDLAPAMAAWMVRAAAGLTGQVDIIAPVPLHRSRYFKRRYNQSAELAKALVPLTPAAYAPDLLQRTRKTPTQDGKNRSERFANQQGAFALNRRADIRKKSVLLVDDVMTTGATLSACAEVLLGHGAKNVDIVVLARVDHGE